MENIVSDFSGLGSERHSSVGDDGVSSQETTPRSKVEARTQQAVTLKLFEAADPPQATNNAKMTTHPNAYVYQTQWKWKGITYTVTFEFDKASSEKMGKLDLERAAKKYAEVFLKDLQDQLEQAIKTSKTKEGEKTQVIESGEHFEVRIRDGGYFIFVLPKEQNSGWLNEEQIRKVGIKVLDVNNSERSSALAKIIAKGITPTLLGEINSIPNKEPKKEKPEIGSTPPINLKNDKEKSEIGSTGPINLKNDNITMCHINAPFQMLVRDKLLKERLDDPKEFIGEKTNPLYQAIQQYRKHKGPGRLNIKGEMKKLKLDTEKYSDVELTWSKLLDQFKGDLKQKLQPILIHGNDLSAEKVAIQGTPFLCLEFPLGAYRSLKEDIDESTKKRFIKILEKNKITTSAIKKEWNPANVSNALTLLETKNTKWAHPWHSELYTGTVKRVQNNIPITENTKTIIQGTSYTIASVVEYIGNGIGGHYVSYITDEQGKHWKMDDLSPNAGAESITPEQFKEAALQGTLLILHRDEKPNRVTSKTRNLKRARRGKIQKGTPPHSDSEASSPAGTNVKAPASVPSERGAPSNHETNVESFSEQGNPRDPETNSEPEVLTPS